MKESKTVVAIVDETIGLSTNPVDSGVNILCPIISPNGPTDLTLVSGPTQLRNYFNAGLAITPDSEKSLKYARAVLNHGPVYIKRACRGNLKGGSTFGKYPSTFYTDRYGNIVDGQKLKFSLDYPRGKSYSELLSGITTLTATSKSYIRLSDTTFTSTENFISQSNELLKSVNKFDPTNLLIFKNIEGTLADEVTINIGSVSYTFNAGGLKDQLSHFFGEIFDEQSTINPLGIYGKGISFSAYSDSNSDWDHEVKDGYELEALAFGNPISVVCSSEDDKELFEVPTVIDPKYSLYLYSIKTEEDYEDTYELTTVDLKLKFSPSSTSTELIHVVTNNVSASPSANYVIEVDDGTTYGEFLSFIIEQLNIYTTVDTSGHSSLIMVNGATLISDNSGSTSDVKVSVTNLTKPGLDVFGIISKFPNSGKSITVNLTSADVEASLYTMSVSYSGMTEDWTFSLLEGAVDGYGNDISYKRVNSDSTLIEIVPINGTSAVPQTIMIGNEVTGDHLGVSDLIAALEYIQEYEESPVNFDYILDGGIVDPSYSSAILKACEVYCSFYPKSCQTENITKTNLENNRGGTSSYRFNFIGATQSESLLDSGIDTFPGSYYYLAARLGMASTVQEFVPLFGPTNGDIGISSPNKVFKKSERESLLDSQIMTLRRSMNTGSWYLNDDLTCYETDSYLQETCTVLMVNTICHIAMNYAETLKGMFNTAQLRSQVTTALTRFISDRLRVGTDYGPDSITVVCNNDNNPQSLINQRKIRIDIYGRFNRSIKDVLIYSYIQPLEE